MTLSTEKGALQSGVNVEGLECAPFAGQRHAAVLTQALGVLILEVEGAAVAES